MFVHYFSNGSDSFTEVSHEGWFSRIGNSIKGVLFGMTLFVAAFPLLFWNEGRAVKRFQDLAEGRGAVVAVRTDQVSPDHEGELVHLTGLATTDDRLQDTDFGIVVDNAIALARIVQMYQWDEDVDTRTEKQIGGGTKTIKEPKYARKWSSSPINSSNFHKPAGHENPPMTLQSKRFTAPKVTLGAFVLSADLVNQIDKTEPIPADSESLTSVASQYAGKVKLTNGEYYLGADPGSPAVGDMRVTFNAVRPTTVSLIAGQAGDSFTAWRTGGGRTLEPRLEVGTLTADDMFTQLEGGNRLFTWILRAVGVAMIFFGVVLVLNPLVVMADVLPFLGSFLGMGIGLLGFLLAMSLGALTIALGWVAYRPMVGISLLLVAAAGLGAVFMLRKPPAQEQFNPA